VRAQRMTRVTINVIAGSWRFAASTGSQAVERSTVGAGRTFLFLKEPRRLQCCELFCDCHVNIG